MQISRQKSNQSPQKINHHFQVHNCKKLIFCVLGLSQRKALSMGFNRYTTLQLCVLY